MKEVKTPKKPLAIYYAIVLLVLMLLNFVLVPWMSERQVKRSGLRHLHVYDRGQRHRPGGYGIEPNHLY